MARCLNFIPDRLGKPRWSKRLTFHHPRGSRFLPEDATPAVLATLHFGPLHLMRYFLRAHGYATTTLIEETASSRAQTKFQKDALSDHVTRLHAVPHIISRHDLFQLRTSLVPGRQLMISVDHNSGRQIEIDTKKGCFRMATGAVRLAARMHARVIPCLIVETGPWEFAIHYANPVPTQFLGELPNLEAAAQHLIAEFRPVLARYPEQADHELRACLTPAKRPERVPAMVDCNT